MTLNWWDAKERKQNGICLRITGSSRSSACYVASTVMQHRDNKARWWRNASLIVLLKGAIWTRIKSCVWDRFFQRGDDVGVHWVANYISDVPMKKRHLFSAITKLSLHISTLHWKLRTSRCTMEDTTGLKATPSKSPKGQVTFTVVWRNFKEWNHFNRNPHDL